MDENVTIRSCLLQGDNDLHGETPLYKYLSVEAFLYLIEFKRLIFSRITTWPDAYEGVRFESFNKFKKNPEYSKNKKDDFYGSCWSLQSEDKRLYDDNDDMKEKNYQAAIDELKRNGSAAMWESYCKYGGVRIKTTLDKLNKLFSTKLQDFRLIRGKAYYEAASSWSKTIKTPNITSALFMKRIPFRYESEYRYILVLNESKKDKIISVEIDDIFDLIDEILVAPATPPNKWISRTLYNIGVGISINPDREGISINSKNGNQFCKISQLYGSISEIVGHYNMA